MKGRATFFALVLLTLLSFFAARAQALEVPLSFNFARSGDRIVAAATFTVPEGYHAYAHNPGSTGLPTTLEFTLEGEGAMPVLYPTGKPDKDIFPPYGQVNIYEGDITLLALLPNGSTDKMYAASIDMLLCSSRHCLPHKESLTGQIPAKLPLLADTSWKDAAETLLAREGDSSGALSLEEGKAPPPIAMHDPLASGTGDDGQSTPTSQPEAPDDFNLDLAPKYPDQNLEIYSIGQAILLGIIAGLLLNAMPCVLPVLTLKVSGLLLIGDMQNPGNIRRFREHNLFFAAGILSFFTGLALTLGAADLMWGQLYQNQIILLAMLLLVFLLGLSMLGVFTLPAFDLRLGANVRNPRLQSYCTGLVSTFLATPCSGPLLGGVLAWAFTQTIDILLTIFWAVGLGMALPYIIFSIWPALARILPRPGKWMYVFEHILGFLLLGTALYLLSILPEEKHMQILSVLLVLSLYAWTWGKFCGLNAPKARRRVLAVLGALILSGAVFWILRPLPPEPDWQDFSPATFLTELGKKNMLVEFTADWCPNCKLLEATVLSDANLRNWQKRYDLTLVKVDLTQPDEYAQRLLQMLGSKSIPLTAIFSKGKDAQKPVVLRDIYGTKTLRNALKEGLTDS